MKAKLYLYRNILVYVNENMRHNKTIVNERPKMLILRRKYIRKQVQ